MFKRLFGVKEELQDPSPWVVASCIDNKKIHRLLGLDLEIWEHPLASHIYRQAKRSYLSKESLDKLEILYKNKYAFVSVFKFSMCHFSVKVPFQHPEWYVIYFLMDQENYNPIEAEIRIGEEKDRQDSIEQARREAEERLKPIREFEEHFRQKIKNLA